MQCFLRFGASCVDFQTKSQNNAILKSLCILLHTEECNSIHGGCELGAGLRTSSAISSYATRSLQNICISVNYSLRVNQTPLRQSCQVDLGKIPTKNIFKKIKRFPIFSQKCPVFQKEAWNRLSMFEIISNKK
jgi:hypothetical protein